MISPHEAAGRLVLRLEQRASVLPSSDRFEAAYLISTGLASADDSGTVSLTASGKNLAVTLRRELDAGL